MMIQSEFEKMIGKPVSDVDYEVINTVLEYHPLMRNATKAFKEREITELYKRFGMTIFLDMCPRAEKNQELEKRLQDAQKEVDQIKDEIRYLLCE